jgi:CubicO group peptidase (beta-lactamase class C family)
LTFLPTDEIQTRNLAMCTRGLDGTPTVNTNGFGMNHPTTVQGTRFFSGGGGLYGTQKDYLRVLQAILRSDPRHGHSDPLISPNSFAELFKDSIPTGDGFTGTSGICKRVLPHGYFDPPATPDRVNHSIAGLLNLYEFPGRRKARSVCWAGAAKTQWWIDPATGLAGIVGTQLLPPGSDPWYKVYVAFETGVYAALVE